MDERDELDRLELPADIAGRRGPHGSASDAALARPDRRDQSAAVGELSLERIRLRVAGRRGDIDRVERSLARQAVPAVARPRT